jgi:hypothetical protein
VGPVKILLWRRATLDSGGLVLWLHTRGHLRLAAAEGGRRTCPWSPKGGLLEVDASFSDLCATGEPILAAAQRRQRAATGMHRSRLNKEGGLTTRKSTEGTSMKAALRDLQAAPRL